MEQLLKPDKLDLDPQAVGASNCFDHWLRCFETFIASSSAVVVTDIDKLHVLHARVSAHIFAMIRDAETYQEAIDLLNGQYNRQPNEVYTRHLLATRRQQPGESTEQFLRELRALGRACSCKAVSAAQNADVLIRDAFVAGIRSTDIRQRLLEQGGLDLQKTVALAGSLEVAFWNLEAYTPDHEGAPWTPRPPPSLYPGRPQTYAMPCPDTELTTAAVSGGPRCYYCSLEKHPRRRCPAKDAICSGCGKKGHYLKVCRAKSASRPSSAVCDPREAPSSTPSSACDPREPPC
ncbi:uncharacterized protein LOC144486857 [Mustelus asterias]